MSVVLRVRVRAKAKRRAVEPQEDGSLAVWTTAAADRGRANEDVIELVADHLGVAKSRISIVRGHTAREKTLEIE